jgi:hypothetical protein
MERILTCYYNRPCGKSVGLNLIAPHVGRLEQTSLLQLVSECKSRNTMIYIRWLGRDTGSTRVQDVIDGNWHQVGTCKFEQAMTLYLSWCAFFVLLYRIFIFLYETRIWGKYILDFDVANYRLSYHEHCTNMRYLNFKTCC